MDRGMSMNEKDRTTARELAHKYLEAGNPLGWFEDLYSQACANCSIIPWADLKPNPNFIEWLNQHGSETSGPALKIGSGLGDDAEEMARRGFQTTAFDISESAIRQARERFPNSTVDYVVADLFHAPNDWQDKFNFVLESYTLQVLPSYLREEAVRCIASFVALGGTLLVIAREREPDEPEGKMPWPLTKQELSFFKKYGLKQLTFEDYLDKEEPPVRRFRITFTRSE
jgi:ubiquinone/menaquinone biosynthesis C-methylase UbiE